jgi:hypothetical protein
LGPDFRQVEDVPAKVLSFHRIEDLHVYHPRWVLSPFDGLEQVLCLLIRIGRMHCGSFVVREVLDPLIGLYMDLHIIEASVLGEFIGGRNKHSCVYTNRAYLSR